MYSAAIAPDPTKTVEATVRLTAEQIAFFHENGFLSVPSISTPEEIERMKAAYDKIFAERAGRDEGNQFDLGGTDEENKQAALPQILNPKKYHADLNNTLAEANARAICKQLLGETCDGGGSHAIFKPARYGAPTPWHQDEAYWNPALEYNSVSVWIPLQEASLANGCMQFIPGTHRWEVQPHHHINNDPRIHGLEADAGFYDASKAVACPIPAGGCTIHPSRTFHYAGANNSDISRRALILGFGLPTKPRTEKRSYAWQEITATAREERAKEFRAKQPPQAPPKSSR
ncbi:MAG: phytanoyl-CoA dioxygenase family protein [Planctomycetota bacterium]